MSFRRVKNRIIKVVIIILVTNFGNSHAERIEAEEDSDNIREIVYFIGDTGEEENIVEFMSNKISNDNFSNTSVIFLGDNIYPFGMPDKNEEGRERAERIITRQIKLLEGVKIYYIPGNHDWAQGRANGLRNLLNQEQFINEKLDQKHAFSPTNGCPGPEVVYKSDKFIIITMDTQWWLHKHEKSPLIPGKCETNTPNTVIDELNDVIADNSEKVIIIAGHHPVISDGNHGGYYSLKDHLFPLTNINKYFYMPLPLIGSIYPLYRSKIGNIQDLSHPEYQYFKHKLQSVLNRYTGLIYASGHDHNLQYHSDNGNHYIVSGSGSKSSYVSPRGNAVFSTSKKGFFRLLFMKNGSAIMEAYGLNGSDNIELIYEEELSFPEKLKSTDAMNYTAMRNSKVTVKAGPRYEASEFHKFLFGEHYRPVWTTPIEVPVLDIRNTHGGLSPVKKGGGMQTKSLRVLGENGHQYVLRSVQKDLSSLLPEELHNTLADDILQDQVSSSHPYGALVIPEMADAAGLFYSIPRLVMIPDDPELRQYRQDFKNNLVLFEQRPDEDLSDISHYGFTHNAIGTPKLLEKMMDDNDIIVDQQELLRNRLFDMFIGDWDRHEDQWRWAEFKCKRDDHHFCEHLPDNDKFYVPISRDRDQVFSKFDGVFPRMASRKWLVRKLQHFDHDIMDMAGMNFNARHLDRTFLTGLDLKEWLRIANELKRSLTDEIIEKAIRTWPDPVYELDGPEIISKLKSRRDKLPESAYRYYKFLAREVNVLGSNKHEFFKVSRISDEETRVTIHKIKKGEIRDIVYQRTFYTSETQEIRLYGFDGKDRFQINGQTDKGILVRVIGGNDHDTYRDKSKVNGIRKHTIIYDTNTGNDINTGAETKNKLSKNLIVNAYDRKGFEYDVLAPNLYSGYNFDNGIYLGGGASYTHHGFRKKPYASYHRLLAGWAFKTQGFDILFNAEYVDLIHNIDLYYDIHISTPRIMNFFGYGNDTDYFRSARDRYYEIKYDEVKINTYFSLGKKDYNQLKIGPKYQYVNVIDIPDSLSDSDISDLSRQIDNSRHFAGFVLQYHLKNTDNEIFPTRGYTVNLNATYNHEFSGKEMSNLILYGRFSFNIPLARKLTYSLNATGSKVFNDFEFYHASHLGGPQPLQDNNLLRGYRRNRFTGRSGMAINQDLRLKLFDFKTYVLPASVGINGFYGLGRVWHEQDPSDVWHTDFGAGIWVTPFHRSVINLSYAISSEENQLNVTLGMLF